MQKPTGERRNERNLLPNIHTLEKKKLFNVVYLQLPAAQSDHSENMKCVLFEIIWAEQTKSYVPSWPLAGRLALRLFSSSS